MYAKKENISINFFLSTRFFPTINSPKKKKNIWIVRSRPQKRRFIKRVHLSPSMSVVKFSFTLVSIVGQIRLVRCTFYSEAQFTLRPKSVEVMKKKAIIGRICPLFVNLRAARAESSSAFVIRIPNPSTV